MTYSGEGDTMIADSEFDELPEYPTAFGITFTPQIIGIGLAVVGLLAAGYVIFSFFMPAWTTYQTSRGERKDRLDQVNAQEFSSLLAKLETVKGEIAKAEDNQRQLYSLFADEKTVNTLLFDINQFFRQKEATMLNFRPQIWEPELVSDGSLGETVNNKLKRQVISLEMTGTFFQTQSILRDIEKLQPLLLLKNFNSEISAQDDLQAQGEPILKTSFALELILPLSEQELEQMKQAQEAAAAQPEGQPQQ
jgi:hypothetical protein